MTPTPPAAPAAAASDAALLDARALDNLRRLDPGGRGQLLSRVLQTYQASMQRLLEQLEDARCRSDPAAMRLAVHTLKSSSASVGAADLSRWCADAEQALRDGRFADAEVPLLNLRSESTRVGRAVQRLLDESNPG